MKLSLRKLHAISREIKMLPSTELVPVEKQVPASDLLFETSFKRDTTSDVVRQVLTQEADRLAANSLRAARASIAADLEKCKLIKTIRDLIKLENAKRRKPIVDKFGLSSIDELIAQKLYLNSVIAISSKFKNVNSCTVVNDEQRKRSQIDSTVAAYTRSAQYLYGDEPVNLSLRIDNVIDERMYNDYHQLHHTSKAELRAIDDALDALNNTIFIDVDGDVAQAIIDFKLV